VASLVVKLLAAGVFSSAVDIDATVLCRDYVHGVLYAQEVMIAVLMVQPVSYLKLCPCCVLPANGISTRDVSNKVCGSAAGWLCES